MHDYLFLMHADAPQPVNEAGWADYLAGLRARGRLQGGSAIGAGLRVRQMAADQEAPGHLSGFIRVSAADLGEARALLAGNPVYEAGGTVDVLSLPVTD